MNTGGSLAGSGTVTANVDQQRPGDPGDSPGMLAINGAYTQTATGVLDIEVGGTTPVTQYDQLNISGPVKLDGTLNISLINGFGATQGQSFRVITFGSRNGTFATFNGLQSGAITLFAANLGANDLILDAASHRREPGIRYA